MNLKPVFTAAVFRPRRPRGPGLLSQPLNAQLRASITRLDCYDPPPKTLSGPLHSTGLLEYLLRPIRGPKRHPTIRRRQDRGTERRASRTALIGGAVGLRIFAQWLPAISPPPPRGEARPRPPCPKLDQSDEFGGSDEERSIPWRNSFPVLDREVQAVRPGGGNHLPPRVAASSARPRGDPGSQGRSVRAVFPAFQGRGLPCAAHPPGEKGR